VVRKVARAVEDGYANELVPGVKASGDAERLADELAFATARLAELAADPPGVYAEIGAEPDVEQAAWLAFLVAVLCPLSGEQPFAGIEAARTGWAGGELPDLEAAARGPRAAGPSRDRGRTVAAYRAWAQRAGSQEAGLSGEAAWTPERRFDRVFERVAVPGFTRPARYEMLVTLGRLGRVALRPTSLQLTDDATTLAAKRVFGIGDKLLLERRARDLAEAAEVPIEALDLALFNWGQPEGERATMGSSAAPSEDVRAVAAGALAL
jgi:hypothetical protein